MLFTILKSLAPGLLLNLFTAPALESGVLADDQGLDGFRVMHGKGKESSYLQSCATAMKLNLTGDLEIKINSVSG